MTRPWTTKKETSILGQIKKDDGSDRAERKADPEPGQRDSDYGKDSTDLSAIPGRL